MFTNIWLLYLNLDDISEISYYQIVLEINNSSSKTSFTWTLSDAHLRQIQIVYNFL